MNQLHPKIYVVCLAAYNAGIDHGRWLNANQKPLSLKRAVKKIIASSPVENAKEWAIHDQEDFGAVRLSEQENLETVAKIAYLIVIKGELGIALVNYFSNVDKAIRALQRYYYGAFASTDELMRREIYTHHIFGSDFFVLEVAGKTHVFDNRANR